MYKIGERRQQRRHNIHSRLHNYTLENIKYNHFALLQTCWTIFEDITSCVNITASFSFANAEVLCCRPSRNPLLLHSIKRHGFRGIRYQYT